MEMLDTIMTNGSNSTVSTATPGPSVATLIAFATLSWGIIVACAILSFLSWCLTPNCNHLCETLNSDDSDCECSDGVTRFSVTATGIGVTIAVAATVLLVVGSEMSVQNGASNGTSGLSSEGTTGRVLLIVLEVVAVLAWIVSAVFVASMWISQLSDINCFCICVLTCSTTFGCVFTAMFVAGVALLGWSSFDFDTTQGNGSNSTVTPGLHTTGVVLSSLGASALLLTLIVLVFVFCLPTCIYCMDDCKLWVNNWIDVPKEWLADVRSGIPTPKDESDESVRLKKSKSLLEEALKRGSVSCRTVVCLLVGVAGAGKTHTKHLLFRWAPPESRNSTPLAARPVQAIRVRVSSQGGQLQEVDPDQLDKIVASTVATGVSLENATFIQTLCCNRQTESTGIDSSSTRLHDPSMLYQPTSQREKFCCCCNDSNSELQQTAKASLDKTAYRIAVPPGSQQLHDCDWIYLIDSGGQIEFLEVLPAFLQHTSVCLFVANLSEELSECPKIEYFENGKQVGEPTLCPFTNEQMLMRCVQTIQTQYIQHNESTNQGSKLVMVGTHQDLAHLCSESTEDKNQRLRGNLCPEFDKSLVFHGPKMEQLIFPVNAKTPGPEDCEVANKITQVIFNVASTLEPRRTPIRWFKFEQLIQSLARDHGRKILHWKECLKIARLLHLSRKDLDAALDHLASFGVIHYYWRLLPDVVFVDPQFLLDKISELVKFHYKLRYTGDLETPIGGEWREFRNEGCLTLKLLKQFPEHYTDFFTPADFLKLMKDRLIVTQLISSDQYFMPCLLRTMEFQEVDQHRVTVSGVVPLAIHFSCKLVPHGIFCSLIAFLRSSQNSSPLKLSPSPESTTEPLCLTRNCIKFQLPEGAPGSLTLIDAFAHFEVYINNAPRDICSRLCPSIWHTLTEGIQKAAETLKYSQLVPKQAFLCKHDNTQPHLALPADAVNYWKCELNPDISGPLTDEHKVWRRKKGIRTPTAEVHIVMEVPSEEDEDDPTVLECIKFQGRERRINIPQEIGTKYHDFGLLLLDDQNGTRVRNMEHKHRGDAERINKEILREWATGRGKASVSWETLIEVLRDIELCTLASEIEAVKLPSATPM